MSWTQVLAIAFSLFNIALVIELIRVRRLKEEYSLLWLFVALIMTVLSIWRDGLEVLAQWTGIVYPPAALFLVLFFGLYLIILHYSVVLSKLSSQVQRAHQELALLRSMQEEQKKNPSSDKKS